MLRRALDRARFRGLVVCQPRVLIAVSGKTSCIAKVRLRRSCGCVSCGGLYNPDRTGEIELEDVAERVTREYLAGYQDNQSSERTIARNVLELLSELVPAATCYLEIGCGDATMAKVIVAEQRRITYTGIELSPALHAAIDPAVRPRVIHEPTFAAAFDRVQDGSQHVMIFHHVLEHLPEPRLVLALARRKLTPGGWFFIEVPNEQWKRTIIRLRRILKRDGEDWFPGHINFFTQDSLRNLLISQGLQIEYERKLTAAGYPEMVKKMLGGEVAFRGNIPARIVYAGLRWAKLESLIGYGIVLRCLCRPSSFGPSP